jgi:Family of unknown function (DUF6498)
VTATPSAPTAARAVPPSALALVAANLFPLFGVVALHWTVFAVILLYWCENVAIGAINVLKMVFAQPRSLSADAIKLFLVPFFVVHYGMFTFVHGVFVLVLFGPASLGRTFPGPATFAAAIRMADVGWGVVFIAASHAFSFLQNYVFGGEYRTASPQLLMIQPYARVVVLHIAILAGGFLTLAIGAPLGALVLLVVLKTALDLRAHLAERRKLAGPAAA